MEGFEDFFIKPVEGHPDLFAFRHDFMLEGKALEDGSKAPTVTEQENGDLIIEGWAASFEGLDREGENFTPTIERGVKAFLEGQSALCVHHQADKGIGTVLNLDIKPEGLWTRARVDFQPESSPLRYIYNAVKKGSYKGLSLGGFFKRALVKGRRMIVDADFTELSITPVAVHPKTRFAVVAGKALTSDIVEMDEPELSAEEIEKFAQALNKYQATLEQFTTQDKTSEED
jgi:phage head maturation protease